MQAFLPLLGTDLTLKGKPGKILNMSSIYGSYTLPFSVSPTSTAYHAACMSTFTDGTDIAMPMAQ